MGKEDEKEPVSPTSRLLQAKELNLCIIVVMGFYTTIDVQLCMNNAYQTFLKHPRFNCVLVEKKGKCWWKRTKVHVDSHVTIPNLEHNMASNDEFVEDYITNLSKIPLDMTKPPWEFHVLNMETSDAKSIAIFKLHHSIGDGVSLISMLHACSRKLSDPEALPVLPLPNKIISPPKSWFLKRLFVWLWSLFVVMIYTLIDVAVHVATILFLKDRQSPIKAPGGAVLPYKRFVHRIVSLDDVKLIKKAMKMSVNDVVLGVTEAGLSRYLISRYEKNGKNDGKIVKNSLPKNLQVRSSVVFNLRPAATIEGLHEMIQNEEINELWGNALGVAYFPFDISLPDDPLTHIRRAKSRMDRKKRSLGHICIYVVMKTLMFFTGTKFTAKIMRRIFVHTTLTFSNVMGPREDVTILGHHLAYICPSVCGFPQSLIIHFQSYTGKLIISIGADEKLIPNPHQLCDDLVKSLEDIKEAVVKGGLLNEDSNV